MPLVRHGWMYEAYAGDDSFEEGKKPGQIRDRVRLNGWWLTRFYGDMCWYACCPCGFYYGASSGLVKREELSPKNLTLFRYCPACGRRNRNTYVPMNKID